MKRRIIFVTWVLIVAMSLGCGGESTQKAKPVKDTPKSVVNDKDKEISQVQKKGFVGKLGRTLLVTQSNFAQNEDGKYVVPDSGELLLLTPAKNIWNVERIKETDSNVFHKAIQYDKGSIFTIGANQAMLKLWKKKAGKWESEVIWNPTFGGEQNRLRDFELADFDNDGKNELAIATHDQGVVAVAWNKEDKWEVKEIDRQANTFVHEIEIGDLDQDGKLEIFSTPSDPNTSSGVDQGGAIFRYAWTGDKFEKSEVVRYERRHIKEVLVADIDGDGKDELYAALEAEMGEKFAIKVPVEIMRYDYKDGKFEATKVISLQDRFCRFLTAGDIDNDGKPELIAAPFSAGIWVIDYTNGAYKGECIDKKTGGFEHAAYLADMNGDDKMELYIADDNGGAIRQYIFTDGVYKSKVISKRLNPRAAMVWNITVADL